VIENVDKTAARKRAPAETLEENIRMLSSWPKDWLRQYCRRRLLRRVIAERRRVKLLQLIEERQFNV
jgi:hypothetical protein